MQTMHGFAMQAEQEISEIAARARLWRHVKTGARLLSLTSDDENKVFGITFRTPPPDHSGVPHILEHSVLCGSRKYPVKEPFVELIKGSLQTFLNAFTYPDKTCYPVASANLQDFYNLIDVYLDAVFYPKLGELVFKQEGWRVEPEKGDGEGAPGLAFKGVVFNEMKGAYSSPESILGEHMLQQMYPDTPYAVDSGGDPERIPDLTYEQFEHFHKTLYHPSNSWIFFHGDDPEDERLRLLNEYLQDFDAVEVDSAVNAQPPFSAPRRIVKPYIAGEEESPRSMLTMGWLLGEATDAADKLQLMVLEEILVGMPGSPLRRALIESGLGEDLVGEGLETELRNMNMGVGLKGVLKENVGKVEDLIVRTLERLAQEGLDDDLVEAALNTVVFDLREGNTGRYPRGLMYMLRCLAGWLYDADPFAMLRFEDDLKTLQERLASGERVFEQLIQRSLLDNPHRVTLQLDPAPGLEAEKAATERARLAELAAGMDAAAMAALEDETRAFNAFQEQMDTPEALATIPRLAVKDLPLENMTIPVEEAEYAGATTLFHDLDTSRIIYLDLAFDVLSFVDYAPALTPLIPMFLRSVVDMGTSRRDYAQMSLLIAQKTGGVAPSLLVQSAFDSDAPVANLVFRGKAVREHGGELLDILKELLLECEFTDQERFLQIVLEAKAGMEESLIPAGHMMAGLRLSAHISRAGKLKELFNGPSQLLFLRKLARVAEEDWPVVRGALEAMKNRLLTRESLVVNLTEDAAGRDLLTPGLHGLINALPTTAPDCASCRESAERFGAVMGESPDVPENEGLIIPGQVNYVAKGVNIYQHQCSYHGAASVLARHVRNTVLWERVRMQGGAYGAFCSLDRASGALLLVSYRDPNVKRTLDVFDSCGDMLREHAVRPEELEKSVVGAIGDMDKYMLPDAKGYTSLVCRLTGESDALRAQLRREVLASSAEHVDMFAGMLDVFAKHGRVSVLGGQTALENELQDTGWPLLRLL